VQVVVRGCVAEGELRVAVAVLEQQQNLALAGWEA
jgi:hypothetical protein